jgi:hypothetical protein
MEKWFSSMLKRGPFRVVCDGSHCDAFIDLETEDFEEAKELKDEQMSAEGWIEVRVTSNGRSFYRSLCDNCQGD